MILDILQSVVRHMKPAPTLMIDNISALFSAAYGHSGLRLIKLVQEFGKAMADRGWISVVLAGFEGRFLDFLYRSSSASRILVTEMPPDISNEMYN